MNKVITVSREFGSGGRELARRLAEKLGYAYYDKEIIDDIVAHTDYSEKYVEDIMENRTYRFYPIKIGATFSMDNDYAIKQMQDIYGAQATVIKQMAERSNCVIVGRCADYILKDNPDIFLFRIFVHAAMESKLARCLKHATKTENVSEKEMKKRIIKVDKGRANYYNDYTLQTWGEKEYYDMCVNSTNINIEEMAGHLSHLFM